MSHERPLAPVGDAENRYFGIDVPFMAHIGLDPVYMEEGLCRTQLNAAPYLVNSRGDIHGGSIMSAMDFTLSAAARSHAPLALGSITIDMTSHFYAPARTSLIIEGRCSRMGRSVVFCDGEARDAHGALVAVARAVFKLVRIEDRTA
ncbi:PaaI family thioesterase [Burkholderia sp. MR1-5-21]